MKKKKAIINSPSGEVITVKELLENISSLAEVFPEVLDYAVVQERNGFIEEVAFMPHIGRWEPMTGKFINGSDKSNSLCIT